MKKKISGKGEKEIDLNFSSRLAKNLLIISCISA